MFDAVRQAAAARMSGLGLMDNFGNSAGFAALARLELGETGIDIFGGPILEPCAGGVSAYVVKIALDYGYGPGTGARFISLPTHHTRHVAQAEGRSPAYVDGCFYVPLRGELPDELKKICDLIAARDVVLNTGFISAEEAIRLSEAAIQRGVERIMVPATHFDVDAIREIAHIGAFAEFSFFGLTHATYVSTINVAAEINAPSSLSLSTMSDRIRAATPDHSIISGDLGIAVLPPPVEGLREFVLTLRGGGFSDPEIRTMISTNPAALFKVGKVDGPVSARSLTADDGESASA